ncbi:nuclear transport factor 2 (NTF2) family protein / RNA recognition motif (RRM)-containing protein [Euphorbia peplus]|nr:nuclear transport factor 2 (NTF2) family protein / RNA recognition motif (RRM)-containing protein [Euphorbia peplus]
MVKNTGCWALKEEEIELDLGLSVGGSYSRQNVAGLKSSDCLRSTISSSFDNATEENNQMTKKEMHALRRQEAKKKREEKQLKRAISKAKENNQNDSQNDVERECKKMKKEEIGACYATPCNPSSVQYETTPDNGFMYPVANVMPCWFTGGSGAMATADEKPMVRVLPVVGYGFVPVDLDHGSGNGYGSEEICSADIGNRKSRSNGSNNNGTSSTGSDHRSSCNEGGGSNSSYTRSHSSPVPQQPQVQSYGSKPSVAKSHSDHTTISNLSESASVNEATTTTTTTNTTSNSTPTETKPKSGRENKPPKPVSQEQTTSTPLPYMPCVSTTGNGPNGKTVNGFLYRYTNTEVSIICVCHGSSFSPAEFVQHAGGTDISHPLKHITVIPSAF